MAFTLRQVDERGQSLYAQNPNDPKLGPLTEAMYALEALGYGPEDEIPDRVLAQVFGQTGVTAKISGGGADRGVAYPTTPNQATRAAIEMGRGGRVAIGGMEQLLEGQAQGRVLADIGVPEGIRDTASLQALSRGEEVAVKPSPSDLARFMPPMPQKPYKADAIGQSRLKNLTTLAETNAQRRAQEKQTYEEDIASKDPIQSMLMEGVGNMAAVPIPVAPIGGAVAAPGMRLASQVGKTAADEAARAAGVGTAKQLGGRAAMAGAVAGGLEETQEGDSRLENALINGVLAGTLTVATEAARGFAYKLRKGEKLTPDELAILSDDVAKANPPEAVKAAADIPEEEVAALRNIGIETARVGDTVNMGSLSPEARARIMATVTPQEESALKPAELERLALARWTGFEPTPGQVARDPRAMDELLSAAQAHEPEAVKRTLAARTAIQDKAEAIREETTGGLDSEGLGKTFKEGVVAPTYSSQTAEIGAKYGESAKKAAESGAKVTPVNTYNAITGLTTPGGEGQSIPRRLRILVQSGRAPQVAGMLDEWAVTLKDSAPDLADEFKRIDAEIDADESLKGSANYAAKQLEKFRAYSNAVSQKGDGTDPVLFDEMRKTLNRYAGQVSSDKDDQKAVLTAIRKAMDEDEKSLPEGFFDEARKLHGEKMELVKNVPMLKKLFKDPEGVTDEDMYKRLVSMPMREWRITEEWIQRHGNKDTRAAWSASKKMAASKMFDDMLKKSSVLSAADDMGEARELISTAGFAKYLDDLSRNPMKLQKAEAILGKKALEELGMVRRALQNLEMPRTEVGMNKSGTAPKWFQMASEKADDWSMSTNAAKRAFGNAIKNSLEAPAKIVQESPEAARRRMVRRELETSVAGEIGRKRDALSARQKTLDEAKGFNWYEEYPMLYMPQATTRGESNGERK